MTEKVLVGIIMGSQSDWETMKHAADVLERLGVAHETQVVSAHRTPDRMFEYAEQAAERGLQVIIAGAGQVGRWLAKLLIEEKIKVTVIRETRAVEYANK